VKCHTAAVRRNPCLVQRALQLRLVAQQQDQGLGLLDGDVHMRWRIRRPFDTNLQVAEFRRVEPECQPLRAIRSVGH